jgi:hypothetical protein
MNKMRRARSLAGILSLALVTIFGFGGTNWIELRFGFFPDGGDGLLEFSFVAIAFVIGASLLVSALKSKVRSRLCSLEGRPLISFTRHRRAATKETWEVKPLGYVCCCLDRPSATSRRRTMPDLFGSA